MPRLHLGSDRRTGLSSRAASQRRCSSSSSSHSPLPPDDKSKVGGTSAAAVATTETADCGLSHDDLSPEFDQFDYDDDSFDYGGDNKQGVTTKGPNDAGIDSEDGVGAARSSSPQLFATTQKSSLPSNKKKQRRRMMFYDSSDSSSSSSCDDGESFMSKNRPVTTKKKTPTKKNTNNSIGGIGRGGPETKLKPTVASLKITLSSLSSKTNSTKKKSVGNKKMPMGKPIKRPSKAKNVRNSEENIENQQRPNRAAYTTNTTITTTSASDKSKKKKAPAVGKKQSVSFSKNTKNNANDKGNDKGIGVKNKRKSKPTNNGSGPTNNSKRSRQVVGCLLDTDEEDFGENSEEGDEVIVVEKKTATNNHKTQTRNSTTQKKAGRVVDTINNSSNDDIVPLQGHRQYDPIQVLPLRGLAVDNRAIPTVTGDSMARHSFLGYIPQLLEGGLEKGVLSSFSASATVVSSLVHGTKCSQQQDDSKGARTVGKGRAGSLVQRAVVPRASYLFGSREQDSAPPIACRLTNYERSLWLSDFLAPINNGFEGHECIDDSGADTGFDYGLDSTMANNTSNNTSNEMNRRRPSGFAAGDSWSYFGDLIEAIEYKLSSFTNTNPKYARPITLFTTDANLFADVRSSAHVGGLEQFWKRIQQSSDASETSTAVVSTVTIVVVETTSVMQMMKTIKSSYDDDPVAISRRHGDVYGNTESLDSSSSFLPNRLHVIQCVNDIRRRIHDLNQSHQLESSPDVVTSPNVNLQLEFIEGNIVSFHSLLQTWVKESFTQTYASSQSCTSTSDSSGGGIVDGVQGRLSFDLPETLDGIMCRISLDLQYTILPHRIDSIATRGLVEDMRYMSKLSPSSVEVVQTISLSSVDSSLIYGVPMSARAGLENDISRYDEMKMLARHLWKYLSRSDMGLVLRAHFARSSDDDSKGEGSAPNSSLGHHSSLGEQLFLLICEEAVEKPQPKALLDHDSNPDTSEAMNIVPDRDSRHRGEAPCHGMLYRYATKSQILRFGNEEKRLEEDQAEGYNSKEVSDHYLDYIERSLDTLDKMGLNPLLVGEDING